MAEKKVLYIFEFVFIALIIITPLFYGSLEPLALTVLQIACLFLLVLFLAHSASNGFSKILYPRQSLLLIFFLLLLIFQLIPLPYVILKMLSPKTAYLYQEYLTGFRHDGAYTLSIYALATKSEIIKYVCFFSIFLVSLNVIKEKKQFERLIMALIIWASLLSLYGVMKRYFIMGKETTYSFSVFYNRNHFSGYMNMIGPLAIGYSLSCVDKFKKILFGFLGALIYASIFLSLSRAGSVSIIFSSLTFVFLMKKELLSREKFLVIVFSAVLAMVFISIAGFEPIKQNFAMFQISLSQRVHAQRDALLMARDFPLFGVGLGNFHYMFTSYNQHVLNRYFYYLLNEHLQLVIETGVAALVYFLFLFFIFRDILAQLKTRHDHFVVMIVIGGACGLFGVLFHSFAEFNFHIPAISFLFWLMLGLIYKCAYSHFN